MPCAYLQVERGMWNVFFLLLSQEFVVNVSQPVKH